MHQNRLAHGLCCLTIERIREFVISVQLIIYAKQNGVKYTTISATGAMAQIGWRRLLLGHGDEVGSDLDSVVKASLSLRSFRRKYKAKLRLN